jgi:transposase
MALPAVGRLGHFAFDEITRHRLSRGGDRAANNALHRIALVRMSAHPQTRGYVQRQPANGRTNNQQRDSEAVQTSHRPRNIQTAGPTHPIDEYRDLRPARQAKYLTLATVATHFGVPLITISRLERAADARSSKGPSDAEGDRHCGVGSLHS